MSIATDTNSSSSLALSPTQGAVNRAGPLPYYQQVADILTREIEAQQPAGKVLALPSEAELIKRFRVSRATVRNALDVLQRQNMIHRQRGAGSFAPVRRVEHELGRLVSTTEAMRSRGWTLVTKVLSVSSITASDDVAEKLEIPPRDPVFRVDRLRVVNGEPLSRQIVHIPARLVPHLDQHDLSGSLFSLIENVYGLQLYQGREILRARGARKDEAQLLGIRFGAPLLATERVTYGVDGMPIEYLDAVWRGDRYDFSAKVTRV